MRITEGGGEWRSVSNCDASSGHHRRKRGGGGGGNGAVYQIVTHLLDTIGEKRIFASFLCPYQPVISSEFS